MQGGCGGFASLISDSIFGSGNANPARKVSVEYARPGDVIVILNKDGKLTHVAIVASKIKEAHACGGICPVVSIYDGNNGGKVGYMEYGTITKAVNSGHAGYSEIWTRYSTNGTPWTGSNTSSSGNNSTSTGNTSSDSNVTYVTTNKPCDICGKVGGPQVQHKNGVYICCESCYNGPSGIGKMYMS